MAAAIVGPGMFDRERGERYRLYAALMVTEIVRAAIIPAPISTEVESP